MLWTAPDANTDDFRTNFRPSARLAVPHQKTCDNFPKFANQSNQRKTIGKFLSLSKSPHFSNVMNHVSTMIDKSEKIIALNINSPPSLTQLSIPVMFLPLHTISNSCSMWKWFSDASALDSCLLHVCAQDMSMGDKVSCFQSGRSRNGELLPRSRMLKYWTWHLIAKYVQKLERHKQHKLNIANYKMNDVDRAESESCKLSLSALGHWPAQHCQPWRWNRLVWMSISELRELFIKEFFTCFAWDWNYSNWVTFFHHLSSLFLPSGGWAGMA